MFTVHTRAITYGIAIHTCHCHQTSQLWGCDFVEQRRASQTSCPGRSADGQQTPSPSHGTHSPSSSLCLVGMLEAQTALGRLHGSRYTGVTLPLPRSSAYLSSLVSAKVSLVESRRISGCQYGCFHCASTWGTGVRWGGVGADSESEAVGIIPGDPVPRAVKAAESSRPFMPSLACFGVNSALTWVMLERPTATDGGQGLLHSSLT